MCQLKYATFNLISIVVLRDDTIGKLSSELVLGSPILCYLPSICLAFSALKGSTDLSFTLPPSPSLFFALPRWPKHRR